MKNTQSIFLKFNILLFIVFIFNSCIDINSNPKQSLNKKDVSFSREMDSLITNDLRNRAFPEATILIDSLKTYSNQNQDYEGLIVSSKWEGTIKLLNGEYEEAIKILQNGLKISSETEGSSSSIPYILIRIGNCYRGLGKPENAFSYYKKANSFQGEKNPKIQTDILNSIGNYYSTTSNLDSALHFYIQGFELLDSIEKVEILSLALKQSKALISNNVASIFNRRKDYKKAIEYYTKAANLKKSYGDSTSLCYTYLGLSSLYFDMKDYDQSLFYNKWVYDFTNKKNRNIYLFCIACSNLSGNYLDIGNLKQAEQFVNIGIENAEKLEDVELLLSLYENKGTLHFDKKEYLKSREFYQKIYSIADSTGLIEYQSRSRKKLSEVSERIGDFSKAYDYLLEHSTLKDSIFDKEKIVALDNLQATYGSRLKADSIKTLTYQKKLDSALINQVQSRNNFYIIFLILSIIISSLLFYLFFKTTL